MPLTAYCVVKAAGIGDDGNTNVQLADAPGGAVLQGAHWLRTRAGKEREMLSTALMAMSSGYSVWVELDEVPKVDKAGNLSAMYAVTSPF